MALDSTKQYSKNYAIESFQPNIFFYRCHSVLEMVKHFKKRLSIANWIELISIVLILRGRIRQNHQIPKPYNNPLQIATIEEEV